MVRRYVLTLLCVTLAASVLLVGCKKEDGVDTSKSIADIKAEAEKMDVDALRKAALDYKDKIMAKKGDLKKLAEELKGIAPAELLGDKAKELKEKIKPIEESISDLTKKLGIYVEKLTEKKGDISGLEL